MGRLTIAHNCNLQLLPSLSWGGKKSNKNWRSEPLTPEFIYLFIYFYFIFILFLFLHIMDECGHKILVACSFYRVMYQVIRLVVAKLQWIMIEQHWRMMSAMLFFMEFVDMALRVRNMWRHEKVWDTWKSTLGEFFFF
jgi:hypothetical protein